MAEGHGHPLVLYNESKHNIRLALVDKANKTLIPAPRNATPVKAHIPRKMACFVPWDFVHTRPPAPITATPGPHLFSDRASARSIARSLDQSQSGSALAHGYIQVHLRRSFLFFFFLVPLSFGECRPAADF